MALVGGRFETLSLAGRGGMGRVFRARDTLDGKIVAVKVLAFDSAETTARFRRESEALARLDHPGIVRWVAGGTGDGEAFLAMEWVEGEVLRARLKRDGRLEAGDVVALGKRLAAALAHAHERGIVHRDIKPSNVILPTQDLGDAVLIDFGLARTEDDELTRSGVIVGTPIYMAPEQVRDNAVAPSVDVFALGCLLYQCLAQTTPFAANGATAVLTRVLFDEPVPLERLAPDVPPGLAALVGAMLRKSPGGRPSMREVEARLAVLEGPADTQAAPTREAAHLSAAELHVVSVIVAGAPARRDESDTMRQAPLGGLDAARAVAIAERFGAESSSLPDGAIVVVLGARGVATAASDVAARAADCALELARALPNAPVALATGRAQTGGDAPIGEAVDRAVALVPFAGDGVRVDEVTAGLLGPRSEIRAERDGLVLRRAVRDPLPTFLGMPAACVGRDAEIATLEGALAQSANESVARVVLVTGGAGVGKSRIRHEIVARVGGAGQTTVWVGRGDAVSAGAPFGVLAPMLRRESGVVDGEPVEASRDKLVARVARTVGAADARRVATFVGEMIGLRFDDRDDVQLRAARADPQLMGDQTQRAFVDLLDAECRAHPVALVIDDLQWGDRATVAAIDAALRVLEERPLAVVAFARPEIAELFPDLWKKRGVQSVPLAPLPKRAATRLARAVLDEKTPDAVRDALVEKAAGNVFFLEELLRAEVEGRGGEVPATVVAMVQSRLEALEPEARRVLRAASVLGGVFVEEGVRALLGDESVDVDRWLDALVRREVLGTRPRRAEDRLEYVFRHALVREGAYAMLTDADRALGHRLAAEWLERRGDAPLLVVAGHWARAGDGARAAVAYLGAADQALESSDLAGALEHATRGLSLGASGALRGALRLVAAHAHHWRGETEEMERAATEAVALLGRDDPRWPDAMTLLAVGKQRLGRGAELVSVADDLFAMLRARGTDRAALARAGGRVASLLFFAGKQDRAAAMLDAAEEAARDGGADLADVAARIHQARAPHARQAGRPEAALRHAEAAEAAFRTAGDLRNACLMSGIRGFALAELGAYDEAERALREALATAERLGLATVAATARSNLGMVCLRLGRPREAEDEVRAAITAFESSDRRHEGGSRAYLALVLRDAGALAAAEEQARRSLVLLEAALALRPLAGAVLANVLLAAGRSEEALAAARDAMRWPDAGGNVEEGDALLRLTLARALFAAGEVDEAHATLAVARNRLLARAHTIDDAALRRSFLTSVPEHATTFELANAWEV